MANIEDLERIDKVVDNIVDLQAKLKEDVESRDVKLQKYEKLFDDMVKIKSDLEAKINGFEMQFKDFTNTNKILETKLESKNARINCLEIKVKALESKMAGLEANKENVLPENETAVLKALNGVNNKRPYTQEGKETSTKKIKINDAVDLSSFEHPKNVQRILNILSLASNLKEFFLPALLSDPTWNLNFEYVPDFSDIEKTETNYVKDSTIESKYAEKGFAVKVYQNPCIKGFLRVDFINRKYESIVPFNVETPHLDFGPGMYRFFESSKSNQIRIRTENMKNTFVRHPNGEITYHNTILDKELTMHKFDTNSLTWTKVKRSY